MISGVTGADHSWKAFSKTNVPVYIALSVFYIPLKMYVSKRP